MNTRNKPDTPPENDVEDKDIEEKIVNFLGIKQSWWRVTSPIYSLVMDAYIAWYFIFVVKYDKHPAEIIGSAAVHLLAVSGGVMFLMFCAIHTGAIFMMIHDKYREWRDGLIREAQEGQRVAEEARLAAEEAIRAEEAAKLAEAEARRAAEEEVRVAAETIAQITAWNERRIAAAENGELFDEPMPNGNHLNIVETLRDERDAWLNWYERRIAAAENGEPFDEPPPNNGTDGTNGR